MTADDFIDLYPPAEDLALSVCSSISDDDLAFQRIVPSAVAVLFDTVGKLRVQSGKGIASRPASLGNCL